MNRELESVLLIANMRQVKNILWPLIDFKNERINWARINFEALSSGQQTALRWAQCLWDSDSSSCSSADLFSSFAALDADMQAAILKATQLRFNYKKINPTFES